MKDDTRLKQGLLTSIGGVQFLWTSHFLMGFAVLCIGLVQNGGRKYVRGDASKVLEMNCDKIYINIFSTNQEEANALVCCNESNSQWWDILSYEGFLCSPQLKELPFARSITKFPESWLILLVPVSVRFCIGILAKCMDISLPTQSSLSSSLKRMLLYIAIMQFRGWGLYVFLNKVEGSLLKKLNSMDYAGLASNDDGSCWFSSLLRNASCHTGQEFDFSDHVVFFFAHSLPIMIFEALYWVLFPCCHSHGTDKEQETATRGKFFLTPTSRFSAHFALFFNVVLPVPLCLAFVYANVIVLISILSTAVYYHTSAETVLGYLISLTVQIPFGLILCSEEWSTIRTFLGFPSRRKHQE